MGATSHELFGMGTRTAPACGPPVALAGRTRLTVTCLVAYTAGALAVALEASADGARWDALATFAAVVPGAHTAASTGETPGFTVAPWYRYVRGHATAVTAGGATFGMTLVAPFVAPEVDAALFTKEFREWRDGYARTVAQAESDVLGALTTRPPVAWGAPGAAAYGGAYGGAYVPGGLAADPAAAELAAGIAEAPVLDARMELPGFGDAFREAVAAQAEHLYRRHQLGQSDKASDLVTLRQHPAYAPGLLRALGAYRNRAAAVFRGR